MDVSEILMTSKAFPSSTCTCDSSSNLFSVFYCKLSSVNFGEIVDHEIISHPKQELKYLIKRTSEGKILLKTRNFHVIPDEVKSKNKYITANANSISLNIHDFDPRQNAVVGPSSPKRQRPEDLVDHCLPDVLDDQSFEESDDDKIFEKDALERYRLSCRSTKKPVFIEHCVNIIQSIGHTIRDLRKAKVGKHMANDKFLKMTEGNWRKSKYAFVISSLKTSPFEISSCIEDALSCIDKLGCKTAEMRGLRNLYCEGKVLNLNHQDNFYCLQIQNDKSDVTDSSIVKQRSDAWHKIRNTAHVTGSTCNKALGLETFKKQQIHYKRVLNEEHVTESPSKEEQMRFDNGTANEINCVATLTGKVLPVFYEQSSYFEEG
ncbi:unnamed protein product [Mytilus coruscus]|uniref:Uncharacterized protein n=1 Tax=Mytilus coruscus TaxID=42192 RepID=A0A6J8BHY9_MYTCO|nr:unnamed protein product [Mytilus coruscus]